LKTKLLTDRTALAIAIAISMAILGLQASAAPPPAIDEWKTIMSQGDLYETKHDHIKAIQAFSAAMVLAEAKKLPPKYLTTALCRRTGSEVHQNLITQSNSDCERLMNLVKVQELNKTLDPDTEVWVLDLANAYQADENKTTRENSLLKLCMINKVLYGENNKEYRNARMLLGKFYEQGQTVKAAQIQSVAEAASVRQAGQNSDPMTQATNLNRLAMHLKISGKLEEAKKAELQLLEIAKSNPGVADGIPAYYAYLGSIALVQNNEPESTGYFAKAIKACSKFKGNKQKEFVVTGLLSGLVDLEVKELKQLLSVQEQMNAVPDGQYAILRALADALSRENKPDEACKCLTQAIAIGARPKSMIAKDIPDLWMHIALIRNSQSRSADANEAFSRALASEVDKACFHATKVLVFWGCLAYQRNDLALATEKLSIAAKQAQALPTAKRGTLLIDSLYGLCMIKIREKDLKANQEFMSKLIPETKEQVALNSNFGPNFWQKLQPGRFIW
jgi:tetratricopeptide (TPR) repeat protein